MSDQFKAALVRGLIGGVVTAGAVLFAGLLQGEPTHTAEIAAGAAGFSYLLVRFGAEGVIDTQNAGKAP